MTIGIEETAKEIEPLPHRSKQVVVRDELLEAAQPI